MSDPILTQPGQGDPGGGYHYPSDADEYVGGAHGAGRRGGERGEGSQHGDSIAASPGVAAPVAPGEARYGMPAPTTGGGGPSAAVPPGGYSGVYGDQPMSLPPVSSLADPLSDQGAPENRLSGQSASVVVAICVVVLLAAVGFGAYRLAYVPYRNAHQPAAALSVPEKVSNLNRVNDPQQVGAGGMDFAALSEKIKTDFGGQETAWGMYVGQSNMLVVIALSKSVEDPEREIQSLMKLGDMPIDQVRDYDAGSIDEYVRCGSTVVQQMPATICGWADHGSLGWGVVTNSSYEESAQLIIDTRSVMVSR